MASPDIIRFLGEGDRDRFCDLMRRYSHDVISSSANFVVGAELGIKLLQMRGAAILTDPESIESAIQPFELLRHLGLALPRILRRYVWGSDPTNPQATALHVQQNWGPCDAAAWDAFVTGYIARASDQVGPIAGLIADLEAWAESGQLTPPDQSGPMRSTLQQIRQTLETVYGLLTPAAADQRVAPLTRDAGAASS